MALSADGNTALIGGASDNGNVGRGVGVHALGRDLDAAGREADRQRRAGPAEFGMSVALSADGNTALIGGLRDDSTRRGLGVHPLGLDLDAAGPEAKGGGETGAGSA